MSQETGDEENAAEIKDKGIVDRTWTYILRIFTMHSTNISTGMIGLTVFVILVVVFTALGKRQSGVCIFDIDTLMTRDYQPTTSALYLQQFCLDNGHDIAVISPRLTEIQDVKLEKSFLQSEFPEIWTSVLIKSNGKNYHLTFYPLAFKVLPNLTAAQIKKNLNKDQAIEAISSYYEKSLQCSVLISYDADETLTKKLGVNILRSVSVSERAGLAKESVKLAVALVESSCNSNTRILPYIFRMSCEQLDISAMDIDCVRHREKGILEACSCVPRVGGKEKENLSYPDERDVVPVVPTLPKPVK